MGTLNLIRDKNEGTYRGRGRENARDHDISRRLPKVRTSRELSWRVKTDDIKKRAGIRHTAGSVGWRIPALQGGHDCSMLRRGCAN